jgi:membrane-associated protease RseP (regulator of RpoE activity)
VAGAQVEVRLGTDLVIAETDAAGRFEVGGMAPGTQVSLWTTAEPDYVQERTVLGVPAGAARDVETTVRLVRHTGPGRRDGAVGVFLGRRGSRTVVTGVSPWQPAEQAGIKVGDVIVSVDGRDVSALGPGGVTYLLTGPTGSATQVVVQTPGSPPRAVTLRRTAK